MHPKRKVCSQARRQHEAERLHLIWRSLGMYLQAETPFRRPRVNLPVYLSHASLNRSLQSPYGIFRTNQGADGKFRSHCVSRSWASPSFTEAAARNLVAFGSYTPSATATLHRCGWMDLVIATGEQLASRA